ncbi:MAG: zf-TFIIB domain-containing protein [Pseudomonadota bacterium]
MLDCPRCDVALRAVLVGDVLVDECTRCSGLWLDHGAFEQVLSRTDFDKLVASIRALRPSQTEPLTLHARPETDERFYVGCPHCDVQMQRRQFGHVSRVVIDTCHEHGMWFDKDELADIVAFVRDGGLQKAEDHVREQRMAAAIRAAKNRDRANSLVEPTDFHSTSLLGIIEALLK